MTGRIIPIAASAALALGLVGCSGLEEPEALNSTSPSAATTQDSTRSTASAAPSGTADDEAEVEAFFREYLKVSAESYRSESALKRRKALFSSSCTICVAGYDIAETIVRSGYSVTGGRTSNVRIEVADLSGSQATLFLTSDTSSAIVRDKSGKVVRRFEGSEDVEAAYKVRKQPSGQWIVIQGEVVG